MPSEALSSQTANLVGREQIAHDTMAFHFDKPNGFEFRAGQAMDITLLDPPETDSEGNIRTFSIASPPFENRLTVATRMRNTAFKRVLKGGRLGITVKIDAPSGSLTLHNNASKPAVFLAGGIGITPFLSIVRQASHDKLSHELNLFYSNRRPEDTPFLDMLMGLQATNPHFHFVPTVTQAEKSHLRWTGETGLINGTMLTKSIPDLRAPIYYIAGPPAVVGAMRQMLVAAGADEDDIRSEEFSGY
jgi:ferredoxin-NADP reductase